MPQASGIFSEPVATGTGSAGADSDAKYAAIAVELVLDRAQDGRAFVERALRDIIHVFNIEMQHDRRAAHRQWPDRAVVWKFVAQIDHVAADRQLRLPDAPVRPFKPEGFGRVEHLCIELDGAGATRHGHVGNHTFAVLRNRVDFRVHGGLLWHGARQTFRGHDTGPLTASTSAHRHGAAFPSRSHCACMAPSAACWTHFPS